jgi:hypothetical protein
MLWPIILSAGAVLTGPMAKDTDYPHRDWGQVATLDMTVAEATACIARQMDREGSVLILPVDGGNDLDYTAGTMFGSVNEPWVRFQVRAAPSTTLRISYRKPVGQKWLRRVMRNFQKSCLRVTNVTSG